MTTVFQTDLFGETHVAGDIVDKIIYLLETDDGCRNSYPETVGRYWFEFDGLDQILPPEVHDAFMRWLNSQATSAKTIQNRCLDIQKKLRPDLDADPEVREKRNRQAKQGPVR